MKRSFESSQDWKDEDKKLEQELFGDVSPPPKRRKTFANNKRKHSETSKSSKTNISSTTGSTGCVWEDKEDSKHKINVSKRRELRNLRSTFTERELSQKEFEKRSQSKYYKMHGKESWVIANEHKTVSKTNKNQNDSHNKEQINKIETKSKQDLESEEKQPNALETDSNNINKNNNTNNTTENSNNDNSDNEANNISSDSNPFFHTSLRMTVMDKEVIDSNNIAYTDLGQLNGKSPHKSVITSLEFHPNGELLLMAGLDKTLQIYQITGKNNMLLKRIFFNDLPIRCAKFTPDGKEIIITGRRYFFYVFDLISFQVSRVDRIIGRDERSWELFYCSPNNLHLIFVGVRGQLVIVSRSTKKPLKTLHISETVSKLRFNFDGSLMYCLSTTGRVYIWDMLKFQCVDRVTCNGVVNATSMSVFPALNLIALGCSSGIVNVYRYDRGVTNGVLLDNITNDMRKNNSSRNSKSNKAEKNNELVTMDANGEKCVLPVYGIDNLVTTITEVAFNHDGQLMILYSKNKKRAVRLVHVQTGTVYANWPKDVRMGYIHRCAFSPHSGYLAIGNDSGYVRLVRLHFYGKL